MKLVIKIVFLFILAIILALLSHYGPGHVVIFIGHYRLDLSISTLFISSLLVYGLGYYLITAIVELFYIPTRLNSFQKRRSAIKSRNYYNISAINFFQADYSSAYSDGLKSISKDIPLTDKFPIFLLIVESINLMDVEDDGNTLDRIDKLLSKLSHEEVVYVYRELEELNEIKNNKFYLLVLNRIKTIKSINDQVQLVNN